MSKSFRRSVSVIFSRSASAAPADAAAGDDVIDAGPVEAADVPLDEGGV